MSLMPVHTAALVKPELGKVLDNASPFDEYVLRSRAQAVRKIRQDMGNAAHARPAT